MAVGTTMVRLLETAAADGVLRPFSGQTDLFIRPPYDFRTVDAMLTNFHLPKHDAVGLGSHIWWRRIDPTCLSGGDFRAVSIL